MYGRNAHKSTGQCYAILLVAFQNQMGYELELKHLLVWAWYFGNFGKKFSEFVQSQATNMGKHKKGGKHRAQRQEARGEEGQSYIRQRIQKYTDGELPKEDALKLKKLVDAQEKTQNANNAWQ